ncbi:carbohydrate-binding module family 5 protein [Ramaria rubella]|nr:carbohydrate-binding module family 5 protein [Ramaria rubella]
MATRALIYALALATVINATQIMYRPDDYKTLESLIRERTTIESGLTKRAGGKLSIGYFTNWLADNSIFAEPSNIVSSILTHVLYSFADVDPNSGNISLTDSYADEQKHFDGDSWDEPGNNLYGCLKQMYLLKMQQRNIKVLLSVGGYTYSQSGHFSFVTNAAYRATFVSSAVSMVESESVSSYDIDFEYPSDSSQGSGFASLVTELRTAFDQLATKKGDTVPYQITVAVSAGSANYANLVVPTMDQALSYWNLMAYDYAGSWSNVSDDMANLYGGVISGVSTDQAFKSYISRGATASKITMGIPLYGRGFEQTAGIRQPYNGVGPGTWEAGVYDYKDLPFAGATVIEETDNVASYSYNSSIQELISYDTPNIVATKTKYINTNGMAGSMFWSLDSDKLGADSLVGVSAGILGGLDQTQVHYPDSIWTNIANNMGNSSGSSSSSSSSSGSPTSSSGPVPTSGSCAGIAAWSASAIYTGGQTATYNGDLWTASWWTQGDTPGGAAGVWVDKGACSGNAKRATSRLFQVKG